MCLVFFGGVFWWWAQSDGVEFRGQLKKEFLSHQVTFLLGNAVFIHTHTHIYIHASLPLATRCMQTLLLLPGNLTSSRFSSELGRPRSPVGPRSPANAPRRACWNWGNEASWSRVRRHQWMAVWICRLDCRSICSQQGKCELFVNYSLFSEEWL